VSDRLVSPANWARVSRGVQFALRDELSEEEHLTIQKYIALGKEFVYLGQLLEDEEEEHAAAMRPVHQGASQKRRDAQPPLVLLRGGLQQGGPARETQAAPVSPPVPNLPPEEHPGCTRMPG